MIRTPKQNLRKPKTNIILPNRLKYRKVLLLRKDMEIEDLVNMAKPTASELEEIITKAIPEPIKGDDGLTPTEEELIALIEPRIPAPIKGDNGKDGKSPTKTEIKGIIKEVLPEEKIVEKVLKKIPKPKDGKDGEKGADGEKMKFSDLTPYEIQLLTGAPGNAGEGVARGGTTGQILSKKSGRNFDTEWIDNTGGGAVDSVNGQTGVVVLDADDIDDTSTTNKFVTASDITKLGNLSGTNTGDVTVSDSSEIDFTLTGQQISASIVSGSIDESKLDTSVNASLDLADTAVQPAALSSYQLTSQKDSANGYAGLDAGGKINSAQIPDIALSQFLGNFTDTTAALANAGVQASQVGDWFTVDTSGGQSWIVTTSLPTTLADITQLKTPTDAVTSVFGRTGAVTAQNGDYTASNITNVPAGNIAATDVQAALNELDTEKVQANGAITGATKTKITYDAKGLVTAGADATTADIADSTDKRYVTDADLTDIGNLSGTNTGDQTITNSSDATSHTVTLSASGGSVQLIEGSGITLTTGGTASAGTVTIAASGGSGATTALDNLASVAINTSLISDTDNTDNLGSSLIRWATGFFTNLGATGTRIVKGWFTDIESTNMPTVGGTAILSSLTAPQFTTVELGHASDTTLSRVSAGVVAVEGKTLANLTDGGTFLADISVPDEAYGSGWNGSTEVPTKNAVYDKIETLSSIKNTMSTDFAASTRYSAAVNGTGSNTYTTNGLVQTTGGTGTSSARIDWGVGQGNNGKIFGDSPLFSTTFFFTGDAANTGSAYVGLGQVTVDGSGHTFTDVHAGFKITTSGGVSTLSATQSGGTESATSLTTLANNDAIELIMKINGSSSIDYYYRKNGGALSSATNISTNMPSTTEATGTIRVSVSNNATANSFAWRLSGLTYTR